MTRASRGIHFFFMGTAPFGEGFYGFLGEGGEGKIGAQPVSAKPKHAGEACVSRHRRLGLRPELRSPSQARRYRSANGFIIPQTGAAV